MAGHEILREAIRKHTCTLLDTIDPKDVIGRLYQDHVLSDDECEDILTTKTRQERAWKLLYHLRHSDSNRQPFRVFVDSLKKDHDFLAEVIEETIEAMCSEDCDQMGCSKKISDIKSTDEVTEKGRGGFACDRPNTKFVSTTCSQKDPKSTYIDCASRHSVGNSGHVKLSELFDELQHILSPEKRTKSTNLIVADGETSSCEEGETEEDLDFEPMGAGNLRSIICAISSAHVQLSADDGGVSSDEEDEWAPGELFQEQFGEYFKHRCQTLGSMSSDCSGYAADTSRSESPFSSLEDSEIERQILQKTIQQMCGMPSANGGKLYRNRQLKLVFNKLSSVINSGGFELFVKHRNMIVEQRPGDADLICLLSYLEACTHLFKGDLRKCEKVIEKALKLVPYTSNPSKVMVEIFSLKCWMYLKENKLNALEYHLSDAAQIIAQDPMAVVGKAAGWLYVDEARRLIPLMTSNNLSRSYGIRNKAIKCLEKALDQFKCDDSQDGPFGYHFAVIKLAMLLLGCGELMQTTDLQPTETELVEASKKLKEVENSSIGLPAILKLQYSMAMSDLHYRRCNLARALNYAEEAYKLTKSMNLPEETRCAKARRDFHKNLQSQSIKFSKLESWGEHREAVGRGNLKYVSTSASDIDDFSCSTPPRVYPNCPIQCVRQSTKLRYFVRLWIVIVLLSSCWIFSETQL